MTDDKLRAALERLRDDAEYIGGVTYVRLDLVRAALAASATDEPHSDAVHRAGYSEDCPACQANDRRLAASATDAVVDPRVTVLNNLMLAFHERGLSGPAVEVVREFRTALAASATDEGPHGTCCENGDFGDGHECLKSVARPAVPALDVERMHKAMLAAGLPDSTAGLYSRAIAREYAASQEQPEMKPLPGICRSCRARVWWNGLFWRNLRGTALHVCAVK